MDFVRRRSSVAAGRDPKKIIEELIEQVKDALKLGPRNLIGIDIGFSAVKIVELKKIKENKFELVRYAFEPLPEAAIIEDEIQNQAQVVEAIEAAYNSQKFSTPLVTLGLWGANTVARRLQLAGGTPEEIEDQVIWEAEQYIPFDIEDSAISFHIVGENEGGGVDVIVAAARKELIDTFKDLAENAGLKVKIVDLVQIALLNVFELVANEELEANERSSWVLLDIGAQQTEFIIYKNGMISFSKQINVGGLMITEEIQRQMGVNYKEAEDLKITGDQDGNLPEEIIEIIDSVVETFFAELKKTLDFYISSTSDEAFAGCYITGGSAQIPGMLEGLEALLGFPVRVLNPMDVIVYDEADFDETELRDFSFRAAAAIGLGMRSLGS